MRKTALAVLLLLSSFFLTADEAVVIPADSEEPSVTPEANIESQGSKISLTNTGEEGSFKVYMNGILQGSDLEELTGLKTGLYDIEIRQSRFAVDKVIHRETVSVDRGANPEVSFRIPGVLRSERTIILRMKKDIARALKNKASLVVLQTKLNQILDDLEDTSFSTDLEEEKLILEDYALKIRIELELRKAVNDFSAGETVDLSYFQRDLYFHDYKSDITTGAVDFSWALKYVLILKRLEMLIPLYEKDYASFVTLGDASIVHFELAGMVSPEFLELYRNDYDYLNALYSVFIEENRISDHRSFREHLEEYYGEIWTTLDLYRRGQFQLNDREVMALRASWLGLDPVVGFSEETLEAERDKWKIFAATGGGSIVSAGIFWNPVKPLGLQLGLSFATNFDGEYTLSVPLEIDGYIINRGLKIYAGISSDVFRYQNMQTTHWSHAILLAGTPEDERISKFALFSSVGLKLGVGFELGRMSVHLNNYFYWKFLEDNSSGFFDQFIYSPSIGVMF